jgi:hypothetical protein
MKRSSFLKALAMAITAPAVIVKVFAKKPKVPLETLNLPDNYTMWSSGDGGWKWEFPKPYEDVFLPGDVIIGYDMATGKVDENLQVLIKYRNEDGELTGEYIFPEDKRFTAFKENVEKAAQHYRKVCSTVIGIRYDTAIKSNH